MSSFNARGELDPNRPIIVTCLGKKGSGKSVMGELIFASYPYDRVVLDVAGDDGPAGDDVILIRGDVDSLPKRWPEHLRKDGQRMTLRYIPDPGSPTYLADMDAVVGMAYRTGRVAILVHEIHELAPAGRTPPHTRRVLRMSRHRKITWIGCGPRAMTVEPLQLQQSDLVFVFETPGPDDRKRIADNIGWDPGTLADAVHGLPDHAYLRYDGNEPPPADGQPDMRLVEFPPLPADVVAMVERQRPNRR